MAKAVETLFNIQTPEQVRQSQQQQDLALGELLTQRPGTAGLLYAPQRSRAIGQGVAGLFGAETRSQAEIDAEENKTLFSGIYQRAQQAHPTDRTAQLNMIAMELSKAGKINEAQKARAMAQESAGISATTAKTQAETARAKAQEKKANAEAITQTDLRSKYSAEAMKAAAQAAKANADALYAEAQTETELDKRTKLLAEAKKAEADAKRLDALATKAAAEAGVVGLGNVDPEKFTTDSLEAFQESVASGNPDYDLLSVREEVDMTTYQKELKAAFPDDPDKRSQLFQKYITEKSQRGGLDVDLDRTEQEWVFNHNAEGIKTYQQRASGAQQVAASVDSLLPTVDEAITGAGSDLKQFVQSVAQSIGVNVDFGDLTGTQLINQFLSREVLGAASGLSGALSDKDIKFLQDTVGGIGNTPEAVRVALAALKNRKLIANATANKALDKFSNRNKATLSLQDTIRFDQIEEEVRAELGLPNPRVFGGAWITIDGTVDPNLAANYTDEQYERATPEAKQALLNYFRSLQQ